MAPDNARRCTCPPADQGKPICPYCEKKRIERFEARLLAAVVRR